MGIFGSSEENVEQKTVDSSGHVNNNNIIQEAHDTHSQMLTNEKMLLATYILVAAEVMKFAIYVFTQWRSSIKRRYKKALNITPPQGE